MIEMARKGRPRYQVTVCEDGECSAVGGFTFDLERAKKRAVSALKRKSRRKFQGKVPAGSVRAEVRKLEGGIFDDSAEWEGVETYGEGRKRPRRRQRPPKQQDED